MSTEFRGRKREIKQVGFDELFKDICYCCYICCKCLVKCKYKNNIPVFWTLVWCLNGIFWILLTSKLFLIPFNISIIYINITFIMVCIFSILSFINIMIVICINPGPIDINWKQWDGKINTKPCIPIHCRTNIDIINNNKINDMELEDLPLTTTTTTNIDLENENNEKIDDERYCKICDHYKPPRTHHCRSCHICIDRMDHHCVWLNACIGYNNHRYFIQFINYYFCLTLFMIPYVIILFLVMSYNIIFIKWSFLIDIKFLFIYLWNGVLVSGGIFVLIMMICLIKRQYFLLSNDITFIEFVYDKRITHGQYSKGSKYKNLKFYLCNPTLLHFLLPIMSRK